MNYKNFTTGAEVEKFLLTTVELDGDAIVKIIDEKFLQSSIIYQLQYSASVSPVVEVKQGAIYWINQIADYLDVKSGSNVDLYDEKAVGQHEFFTVPAINSRMATFHTVRGAVQAGENLGVPHIIFELAFSEGGYTGQDMSEYAALVKAAYISLGVKNKTIYLQADHYQLDPKKYAIDADSEMARLQKNIILAIESGVYNIDIDTSKFETDDRAKSDQENQKENAHLTAKFLAFIRQYEAEHKLPCVISVGGEVGEVGGGNTKYSQVSAYLELIAEDLKKIKMDKIKGLSKVSINVGSAHGGVLGKDGQPLESVPLDFQAHHDVYMKAVDPLNHGKHVLSVQHGASTLPARYFPLFPAMHVAEIHLATGFQNIVWDVLEKYDVDLYNKLKALTMEKFAEKISKYETESIGFMKERKRVTEFVKNDLLLSPAVSKIEQAVEKECEQIFYSLYNTFLVKNGIEQSGDRAD
ncbi:MAG: class II fructose-bisphosphate aldolase [Candidatus Magasanikbacteria bacterium]|jgi:fructose/tagatose bisphosphate aldolase